MSLFFPLRWTLPLLLPTTQPSQAPQAGTLQNLLVPSTPTIPGFHPWVQRTWRKPPGLGPMARWQPTSACVSKDGGIRDTRRQSLCPRAHGTGKMGPAQSPPPSPASQTSVLGHCSLRELRSGAQRRETTDWPRRWTKAAWRKAPCRGRAEGAESGQDAERGLG